MSAAEIVQKMMQGDHFSKWMGVEVLDVSEGLAILQMVLTKEMVNGFSIAHGGISYSLSDSALAFAANSYGKKCVSIETSISHTRPANIGDTLTAKCIELHRGKTVGIYQVTITNQLEKVISLFKGTVHISTENW
jgi:acyl-CoA thioesterase